MPFTEDRPRIWFRERQYLFQQSRLARSAPAEEHEDLAPIHVEVDAVQHAAFPVACR